MPNVKIHIEEAVFLACKTTLIADLPGLRDLLCHTLGVEHAACQLAILPVYGLPDQPLVNVELSILPKPDRTREKLLALAGAIRVRLEPLTAAPVAVRISQLDSVSYVALK